MASLADKKKALDWSKRNAQGLQGILDVNSFIPVTGDVQSGILAAQDVKKGNYGSAALNAVGLLPFVPSFAGTFIGKGSKVWDAVKADEAVKLEKAGVAPEEIWKQTGTVRGVDGKLRQEISDAKSSVAAFPKDLNTANLTDILVHKELQQAYPDLSQVKVSKGSSSYYAPNLNQVKIGQFQNKLIDEKKYNKELNKLYKEAESLEKKGLLTPEKDFELNEKLNFIDNKYSNGEYGLFLEKQPLLHETQHIIQNKEGFAKGGSPEEMRDVALDMLRRDVASGEIPSTSQAMSLLPMAQQNAYRRLAGEAESRLTEARRDLTPSQRLQYFPYNQGKYGLDVPYESLIVRGILE
jgi:hypothetical protein